MSGRGRFAARLCRSFGRRTAARFRRAQTLRHGRISAIRILAGRRIRPARISRQRHRTRAHRLLPANRPLLTPARPLPLYARRTGGLRQIRLAGNRDAMAQRRNRLRDETGFTGRLKT